MSCGFTTYSLSAMELNDKECNHIMRNIVKFGHTKAGKSSTLHTVVRYGPQSLGRIGIFDPFLNLRIRMNSLSHQTISEIDSILTTPLGQPIYSTP